MSINYKWYKIANTQTELMLSNEGLVDVEVNGQRVAIALYKNNLFGFSSKCPHAGGKLSNGYLDAVGNIVCPLHRYKFSLKTGRNMSGEGYFLKTYPVEVRLDGIFIGFKEINPEILINN